LFGFGGDSFWPAMTVGYAHQTRRWMTRAMEDEVDEGCLTEEAAMDVAGRIMRDNQLEYFDLPGTRAAIRSRQLDGVPVSS
jgi:hypothetical protein